MKTILHTFYASEMFSDLTFIRHAKEKIFENQGYIKTDTREWQYEQKETTSSSFQML